MVNTRLDLVNKYASLVVGFGNYNSKTIKSDLVRHFKYKSIDLNLWKPKLSIPKKFQQPKTEKIKILHSFSDKDRNEGGRNIVGSPHIIKAINRLKSEGYPVEYTYLNRVHISEVRFFRPKQI